jgi:GMP synthase (glutamine-hydrolysing)
MPGADTDSLKLYVVRNEVDPACEYHCDAVAAAFPDAEEVDFVAGERVPLDEAAGVVLTGSTAGVYESPSRPWIAEQEVFVRDLVDREIPTLGVCFGHQIANSALGGTVEEIGTTASLVEATLADDQLFDGVDPVVVSLHGDAVTTPGENMDVIASASHARIFGTRHQTAPLWTVQFHPEISAHHRNRLVEDFGWETDQNSFADVTAERVFENFQTLIGERSL